ncbi:PREDICTED: apoptotic chromatin condensation inducer in the nucleus isoform X2 [Tarenaya hassleriana]|uniref:apoptotic chromatin condensation inducer in the nucleus isoform X2 n=1 Tax=Tarenaya hassleriana TaxID=28532 RepID=UPI0008FD8A86|nr:PREDICTED: apoptotic chromatin condensation inducer in the nucleus isoform X2 [Tarenaya hassleriana]
MSSPYPILDNRPIDKWKVTELKEELKRRRLTTGGLKVDLIKRLDEALRIEREDAERVARAVEEVNQDAEMTPKIGEVTPVAAGEVAFPTETTPSAAETTPAFVETDALETTPVQAKVKDNSVKKTDDRDEKVDDVRNVGGLDKSMVDVKQLDVQEGYVKDETAEVQSGITAADSVVAEGTSTGILHKPYVDSEDRELSSGLDDEDAKLQPENEGVKAHLTDGFHDKSAPNNEVYEVSPVTGLEVKSDCISTDSVSNNEKTELKDNVIADDVKLEHNVNKSQEMVEPSSVGGESHPMDVEQPLEQKTSVEDKDDNHAANDNIDAADSEKLNLDRISGDDSMEEEADTKQTESNNSDEVNKSEKSEVPADNVETPIDVVGNDSGVGKGDLSESKNQPGAVSEKRKLPVTDKEAGGNNDAVKRQRRWNSENIKVPEVQNRNSTPITIPKSSGLKRNFSRSDSTASEDGPKERVVPPPQKEPTNSLRIDRFLRPFTLKAVQELLGETGNVTSFWMDQIKTHCYVSYSSVEEAMATRNAIYSLQWPPNGGRLLVAEFVGPEEVKAKVEAPQTAATLSQPAPPQSLPPSQPSPRPQGSKAPTAALAQPPLPSPTPARERLQPPPPPPAPVAEQQEPPIVTLDDLFRKTKATPRIYYLPLSEDQVAAKLAAQGKSSNN